MFGSCNFGKLHLRTHLRIQKSRENDWFTSKLHELYTIYFHSVRDTAFFHRRNRRGLTQTRAPPSRARERHRTRAHSRVKLDVHATLAPALRLGARYAGRSLHSPDGRTHPAKGREGPCRSRRLWRSRSRRHRGCARASLAGPSGCGYRPRRRLPRLVTAGAAPPRWTEGGVRILQRSVVFVATPFALDARVARRPGAPGVGRRAGDDLRGRGCPGLRSRTRQGPSKTGRRRRASSTSNAPRRPRTTALR